MLLMAQFKVLTCSWNASGVMVSSFSLTMYPLQPKRLSYILNTYKYRNHALTGCVAFSRWSFERDKAVALPHLIHFHLKPFERMDWLITKQLDWFK